ncbi:hypothetical protein GQ54DRAFT_309383 [Martensiomyces pterosporus]|nr:hypothetical protein GQ54DRAFT_309383 [Martensiomyces pterosporus]
MSAKFLARAHHAYSQSKPDELDLTPGDQIRVTNDEHPTWWVGDNTTTGKSGWFPSNFVEKVAEPPRATPPPRSRPKFKRMARVVEQFDGAEDDDLSLRVGDIVEVVKEADGWCLGRCNGKTGMFPAGYIEDIDASEVPAQEETPVHRPLPTPPVPGAVALLPPVPGVPPPSLPRRSTSSQAGSLPPQGLPAVPAQQQTPHPPQRSSTEHPAAEKKQTTPASGDAGDDGKKDKHKTTKRISRLFTTKKHKDKGAVETTGPPAHKAPSNNDGTSLRSVPSVQSSHTADDQQLRTEGSTHDEEHEEEMVSPALPGRPLPQPSPASPRGSGRPSLPQIPPMNLAKPPPIPAAAAPPPPAALPAAPDRRPSASSITAPGSGIALPPLPQQPHAQRVPSVVGGDDEPKDTEHDGESEPAPNRRSDEPRPEGDADEPESNNNEENEDSAEASAKPRGQARLAKVVEDYEAESNEELNLISGDVVTILQRGTEGEPRWKGEYHGKKGYFPAHVVEPIEESADLDDEEGENGEAKPKGFKLAAYGVQQGGLGSIFAAGGMPALRKPAPRKPSEHEGPAEPQAPAAPAPAPAAAPVIPKLRSIRRPSPKEEPKEEPPNFLAQLNHVPRKSTSLEEAPAAHAPAPAPAPAPPVARKLTSDSSSEAAEKHHEKEITSEPIQEQKEEHADNEVDAGSEHVVKPTHSDAEADADSDDEAGGAPFEDAKHAQDSETTGAEDQLESQADDEISDAVGRDVAEGSHADTHDDEPVAEEAEEASSPPALEPVKAPSLPHVKRLVRRAPRQKPTTEGLKKQSEESQSQSLQSALEKDRDFVPEPEPGPAKATPPALPEKPKGLARHGPFGGPQLPSGGFKASGRIGSAMASRLAALQARASGGGAGDDENDDSTARSVPAAGSASSASRSPSFDTTPSQVARKPSYAPRAPSEPHAAPSPAVSSEWQRQVEDEQASLRKEVEKAKRAGEQVEQLASKLSASENERGAQRQTISQLERHIESMTAQLSALQADLSHVQRSVSDLGASKGVSADEVGPLLRAELRNALQPLHQQNQELRDENKQLRDEIKNLRSYVDELVVEE